MSTVALLLLVFLTHYAYEGAPHKWAAFASGLGALTAVLLWERRGVGPRIGWWKLWNDSRQWPTARWMLCVWGSFEGWQVFACQGAANWWDGEAPPFEGMCGALTGLPMYGVGLGILAVIAGKVASER